MKTKKWIAGMLSVLFASTFALAGCTSTPGGVSTPPAGNSSSEVPEVQGGQLNIFLNEQGYGSDWLRALGAKFQELFGTQVLVVADPSNSIGTDAIGNETSQYDLVFSGAAITQYVSKGQLVNINDVFNTKPSGEDKTVAEKLASTGMEELFRFGSNYYMLPWETTFSSFHYNVNVLNSVFGEGKWEEPVTTDELLDMLEELKEIESAKPADTRAYGVVISPELNYWMYAVETWWGQYEGYDDFYNYYYGEYYDGNTKKVATDQAGYRKSLDVTGRLRALEVLTEILNEKNGHVNPVSEGLGYVEHQEQLASGKYQSNKNPSAFLVCGDWYEKETFAAVQQNGEPVRFMRMPVISSITETLEDKDMSDETLAEVIRAIDAGKTEYAGVSANDFARIKEARQMISCGTMNHTVAIPKNARNIDNAKAFLVFMASDLGQSIFAQQNGGRTQPYGYDATNDSSITISKYTQSILDAYGKEFLPVTMDYRSPLVAFGGLTNYGNQAALDITFWKNNSTPKAYHDYAVDYEAKRYDQIKMYISSSVRN